MYTGQCTVNVESGIQEGVASISGSVSETVGYFSIDSFRSLTFASDDSTPGSEVSIDYFTFYQECITNQHKITLASQCQILALSCAQVNCGVAAPCCGHSLPWSHSLFILNHCASLNPPSHVPTHLFIGIRPASLAVTTIFTAEDFQSSRPNNLHHQR